MMPDDENDDLNTLNPDLFRIEQNITDKNYRQPWKKEKNDNILLLLFSNIYMYILNVNANLYILTCMVDLCWLKLQINTFNSYKFFLWFLITSSLIIGMRSYIIYKR